MVWAASRAGRISRSARRLRPIQTPTTTPSTITSTVATSVEASVVMLSCHSPVPTSSAEAHRGGDAARAGRRAPRPSATRTAADEPPRRLGEQRLERVEQAVGDGVLEAVGEAATGCPAPSWSPRRRRVARCAPPTPAVAGELGRPEVGVGQVDARPAVDRAAGQRAGAGADFAKRLGRRRAASARSLAAVVTRSRTIAMTTMARPRVERRADVERLQRLERRSCRGRARRSARRWSPSTARP